MVAATRAEFGGVPVLESLRALHRAHAAAAPSLLPRPTVVATRAATYRTMRTWLLAELEGVFAALAAVETRRG